MESVLKKTDEELKVNWTWGTSYIRFINIKQLVPV